jgi:AcrR family transcriptional regulator
MKQNTASARVVGDLRDRIKRGALAPGQAVPSARQIVKQWGVAIATATKALAQLRKDGLVRVEPGVGTIVIGERAQELSRVRIVEAAIAIADDEGTAALSMRTVGRELGVATMSLYRHVPSKEVLLELMADAVFAETPVPRPPARADWKKYLQVLARAAWQTYQRHRWLAPMISMTRPQRLPHGMKHTEAVLFALTRLGLPDDDVLPIGIALQGYVRGMAAGLEDEREAERDSGLDQREWLSAQEAQFAPLFAKLPTLRRLSEAKHDVDMSLDALFEAGLRVFLAGLG